jgi:hypothetical protein
MDSYSLLRKLKVNQINDQALQVVFKSVIIIDRSLEHSGVAILICMVAKAHIPKIHQIQNWRLMGRQCFIMQHFCILASLVSIYNEPIYKSSKWRSILTRCWYILDITG